MVGKVIRTSILLLYTALIIRGAWRLYQLIYDLLDFQVSIYSYMVQAQDGLSSLKDQAQGSRQHIMDFVGAGNEGKSEILGSTDVTGIERVALFAKKLKIISGVLSGIIGLFVWKIGFDLLFGIKRIIERLSSFVRD